jgi:lysozyme
VPRERTVIVIVTATSLPPARHISEEGIRLIEFFEGGASLVASYDVANHCTIGIGHLIDDIWCIGELRAKPEDVQKWFREDIKKVELHIASKIGGARMNSCQFDAIASFVFNLGPYYFDNSGLVAALRDGEFDRVPDILGKYVYAGGQGPIRGLQVRRAAEAKLFSECVYMTQ